MSHFIVTVALSAPDASLDAILEPYDENKAVEAYPSDNIAQIVAEPRFQEWIKEHPDLSESEAVARWLGYEPTLDEDGNVMSTYNPQSKWDWYEEGGRWDGFLTLKDGRTVNRATVADLAAEALVPPFAYIDRDGTWHEKGSMGWFGISTDNKEQEVWTAQFVEWLQALPKDTVLVAVDCHI